MFVPDRFFRERVDELWSSVVDDPPVAPVNVVKLE